MIYIYITVNQLENRAAKLLKISLTTYTSPITRYKDYSFMPKIRTKGINRLKLITES